MFGISQELAPADSLLRTYRGGKHPERWGSYGDCFSMTVNRAASLGDFVFAFYTSWAFRIERLILRILVGAVSTDADARAVANGSGESFAIWRVGERTPTQLLMCDRYEKTRSWFRVVPVNGGGTLLQFGSAVAAVRENRTGSKSMGEVFRLLLGFHVAYSQVLLRAAMAGLKKSSVETTTRSN
jgi:hypothetical protein